MKTYSEVDPELHIFLTLALKGGEWSDSCPCHVTSHAHCKGGWVGTRTSQDTTGKEKTSLSYQVLKLILWLPRFSLVTLLTEPNKTKQLKILGTLLRGLTLNKAHPTICFIVYVNNCITLQKLLVQTTAIRLVSKCKNTNS